MSVVIKGLKMAPSMVLCLLAAPCSAPVVYELASRINLVNMILLPNHFVVQGLVHEIIPALVITCIGLAWHSLFQG